MYRIINKEERVLCKSCGKTFGKITTIKNCDACNRKYRSNYQNTLCRKCNVRPVEFPTDPMCKKCYKLTEKENAELVALYKSQGRWY